MTSTSFLWRQERGNGETGIADCGLRIGDRIHRGDPENAERESRVSDLASRVSGLGSRCLGAEPLPFIIRVIIGAVVYLVLISTARCEETRWMKVTAYCPCRICCGPNACGITATGRRAVGAIVAVDPRVVRLGNMVHVPGRGWTAAEDTGRLIKGARLDVLCATHAEAKRFGVRWMRVTIMTRGEWERKKEDERFERMFADLVAAGRRLTQSRTGVPPVQSSINGQAGRLSSLEAER